MDKNNHILIIDDEEQVLEMMKEILEEEGYYSDVCTSGEDALKMVENGRYKLVISDVRMQGMDGFKVLEEMKQRFQDIRVILMTGYTDDYDISNALILGADDYITKPFDVDKVLLAVSGALEQ